MHWCWAILLIVKPSYHQNVRPPIHNSFVVWGGLFYFGILLIHLIIKWSLSQQMTLAKCESLSIILRAKVELVIKKISHHNIGNISVFNHEDKPVDFTQAICKLCPRVIQVKKSQTPINYSLQNATVKTDCALTAHILSETTRWIYFNICW